MRFRIGRKDLLFILSLVIIFAQYIYVIDFNYYSQFIVAIIWICYDYLNIVRNRGLKGRYSDDIKFFRKIYLTPWIVIAIYSFIIYSFGLTENVPLRTYIASNVTVLIIILFAFSALHIFKENTFKDSIIALMIIYIIVTLKAVIKRGPLIIITKLIEIFTTLDSRGNPFEIGDCTFAAGLVFLMYLYYGRKKTKKERKYLVICGFFIVLGLKRIQILSLILVISIGLLLKYIKRKYVKNLIMNVITIAFIAVATLYIFFIDSDSNLAGWTSLDMGRYHLYTYINDFFDFSLGYLGHGYGFSNKFIELNTHFSITVLHSDIIRMFVELGFIGFYSWMIYYMYIARKVIEKKYGMAFAYRYFFMTVYLFITYFTDNTINYFVTQYFNAIMLTTLLVGNPMFVLDDQGESDRKIVV